MVVMGGSTGVLAYDVETLSLKWFAPTPANASAEWSHDGAKVAAGLMDGTILVLDARDGHELLNLPSDDGYAMTLDWTPDDRYLVYSAAKAGVIIRDAVSGALLNTIVFREEEPQPNYMRPFVIGTLSPDGKHVLTRLNYQDPGSPDSNAATLAVWNIPSGALNWLIDTDGYAPDWVSWSPDSQRIAAGSRYLAEIPIWDIGTRTRSFDLMAESTYAHPYWSPDGTKIFVHTFDEYSSVMDVASNKSLVTFNTRARYFVRWSEDGARLVFRDDDSRMLSISTASGEDVQADGDAKYFLRAGRDYPHIALWDDAEGGFTHTLLVPTSPVRALAWSEDGKQIDVTYADTSIRWDVESGRPLLATEPTQSVPRVEAAGADFRLVSGGALNQGDELCSKYRELADITDPLLSSIYDAELDKVGCATESAASTDGRLIAVAFNNLFYSMMDYGVYYGEKAGAIGVFDAGSMQRLAILRGHSRYVLTMAFSPDGKLLATGSDDGTVIIWKIAE
jgi:WD40 repeat protein